MTEHLFLKAIVDNRGPRIYYDPVGRRVHMKGLIKLIEKATGMHPKLNEPYAFAVKNKSLVKMLTRVEVSTNLLELHVM